MYTTIGLLIILPGICYKLAEIDDRLSPALCAGISLVCTLVGLFLLGGSFLAVLGLHALAFVIGCLVMLWRSDRPTSG